MSGGKAGGNFSARSRPLRTAAGRPTPAGVIADGLRRRRDARQDTVRLHDADGALRTLVAGDPVAEALVAAARKCIVAE
jgi:hypothetical protein